MLSDLIKILKGDKSAFLGALIIVLYILMATVGQVVVPLTNVTNPGLAYEAPSWAHWLGTDWAGKGVLAEVVHGSPPILMVAVSASLLMVAVGVLVGLSAGYAGGLADMILMRLADIFLTIPSLPLVIVLATFVKATNPLILAAILSVTSWAGLARAVRSQALSLRQRDFIEAASIQGLSRSTILFRQLLPNIGPYVAIHFLLGITGAIYAEVGLFLLGIAPFSSNNWGVMLNIAINQGGALYSSRSVFYLVSPMAAIVILQLGFVLFTRALDQLFNPRLRRA